MSNAIQDSSVRFPRKQYTLRLMEKEFKISQKTQNPMLQLDWEVAAPDEVRIGMEMYVCAGLRSRNWMMLDENGLSYTKKFLEKAGVVIPGLTRENIDNSPESIDWSPMDNMLVKAMCGSKVDPIMEEVYDDNGNLTRVPLKDDEGKPITSWKFEFSLRDVLAKG